mmetsp:Transcript_19613/g.52770  ORF Transcript_19613/g.52770 Transcript_19613/m.52770 type:complete len:279 (-) Transcript_19613:70-906(-)
MKEEALALRPHPPRMVNGVRRVRPITRHLALLSLAPQPRIQQDHDHAHRGLLPRGVQQTKLLCLPVLQLFELLQLLVTWCHRNDKDPLADCLTQSLHRILQSFGFREASDSNPAGVAPSALRFHGELLITEEHTQVLGILQPVEHYHPSSGELAVGQGNVLCCQLSLWGLQWRDLVSSTHAEAQFQARRQVNIHPRQGLFHGGHHDVLHALYQLLRRCRRINLHILVALVIAAAAEDEVPRSAREPRDLCCPPWSPCGGSRPHQEDAGGTGRSNSNCC